jgi:hypothetical protein
MYPALATEIDLSRKSVLGIMDFRYAPYALGDTFTWLTNLQIVGHSHGGMPIEIVLVTIPEKPASPMQRQISSYNYAQILENLLPAFLTCPSLLGVRIFENKKKLSQRLLGAMLARATSWPSLTSHFRQKLDYYSHAKINAFYAKNKWLPRLQAPVGFHNETEVFRAKYLGGRAPIVVNFRQRALTHDPQALARDSVADAWYEFFIQAQSRWPKAVFAVAGGFNEWERRFAGLANVVIPRMFGFGLGHELTLLFEGAPFFGSSSGFSAAATFSNTPYTITNFEHRAAEFVGVPVGTERYPFSAEHQWLSWEPETKEVLLGLFDHLWEATRRTPKEIKSGA